jgi:hypothetical protein
MAVQLGQSLFMRRTQAITAPAAHGRIRIDDRQNARTARDRLAANATRITGSAGSS